MGGSYLSPGPLYLPPGLRGRVDMLQKSSLESHFREIAPDTAVILEVGPFYLFPNLCEMIGVLVDVSGSMQSAYSLDESRHSVNVERTQAVLTTIVNIVDKEVTRHRREESIFSCAFGLRDTTKKETCDLLTLLEYESDPLYTRINGHEALIEMARERGHSELERWIPQHLSQFEAKYLHKALRSDTSLIDNLAELLPNPMTGAAAMAIAETSDTVSR